MLNNSEFSSNVTVFKEIQEGSRYDSYEDTFFWLSDSQISNECFLCNDPNVDLSLNEDRTYIKCYMGDTGLLVTHAFNDNEVVDNDLYKEILTGELNQYFARTKNQS